MPLLLRIWNALKRRVRHARILVSARRTSQENLRHSRGGNILVLCYGNIYRSPFVEQRLTQLLDKERYQIRSAGFYHRTGRPCAPGFIKLAGELGVTLHDHRSAQVSRADIDWSDLIVIMDRKNWDALWTMSPDSGDKIIWIGSHTDGRSAEVGDPYGSDEAEIRKTLQRLNTASEGIARALAGTVG